MAMKQCPGGHVYDDQKTPVCPYCTGSGNVGVTRPLAGAPPVQAPVFQAPPPQAPPPQSLPPQAPAFQPPPVNPAAASAPIPKTAPLQQSAPIPKTMPLESPETNKTMALNTNDMGIDPVRGWLICVDGEKKGKDFKIRSEKNYVGRQSSNEICLDFDNSVSREPNAIISYDCRNNKFFIQPGEGKNNVYLNDSLLLTPVELNEYDIIEIGKTKLTFRSLCNEKFKWD